MEREINSVAPIPTNTECILASELGTQSPQRQTVDKMFSVATGEGQDSNILSKGFGKRQETGQEAS